MNGRILYIFTTKSLIGAGAGALLGFVIYYLLKTIFNLSRFGLILTLVFAAIGYGITTLKVPESNNFAITRKTGGDRLDDVILRTIKYKAKGKRIYIYTKEEDKK